MFEPPFNKGTVAGWTLFCVGGGVGTIMFAVNWQVCIVADTRG